MELIRTKIIELEQNEWRVEFIWIKLTRNIEGMKRQIKSKGGGK